MPASRPRNSDSVDSTHPSHNPVHRAGPSTRVLLVIDDPFDEVTIRRFLSEWRADAFETRSTDRVEEAVLLLKDDDFDVVLLDVAGHATDGLTILQRARATEKSVPVVVMTSATEDDSLEYTCLRLGAQDHLLKEEVTPRLLSRSLRHAVERHRLLRDLSVARQREQYLATHDALTGLINRASLQDHLRRSLDDANLNGRKLAVLFIDLDGFKAVNDNLGHAVGDTVLTGVATRLSRSLRSTDVVARLGGDEFVVTIENADDSFALATILENIRGELAKPFELDGPECWITASIGVALFPRDGCDPEPLIRSADTAMYHAKAQGPNQYEFYEDAMDAHGGDRFQLVNDLHEAIDRDELVLFYQPQVDVGLRQIIGAEALVRWRHPNRGLISPGDFIRLAEETGMIMPIGEWVLRAACEDVVRWKLDPHSSFRVGVNVSGRQISQHGFSQEVACILAETGLPAGRLEVEITETSVLEANETTLATLSNLRRLGVNIAMDDFGTGYSSLARLRELELDRLKIDQSFIRGTGSLGPDRVIVGGLVGLARGLGITTIGEGVESREQLESLYTQGCHQMQGYLFGKPVSSADFAEMLSCDEMPWEADIDATGID